MSAVGMGTFGIVPVEEVTTGAADAVTVWLGGGKTSDGMEKGRGRTVPVEEAGVDEIGVWSWRDGGGV